MKELKTVVKMAHMAHKANVDKIMTQREDLTSRIHTDAGDCHRSEKMMERDMRKLQVHTMTDGLVNLENARWEMQVQILSAVYGYSEVRAEISEILYGGKS